MIDTTFIVHAKGDDDFKTEIERVPADETIDSKESYMMRFKSGDFWLSVSVDTEQLLNHYEQLTREITNAG